jgi:type III pantothenate kinase
MDVFALTSAVEGFGIVFAEAAFCGLPCIGSAVGGIVDAIEDGVTGVLVPATDVAAIARAMLQWADDPDLRRRMGEAGRQRAARLHTVQGYGARFDALFLDALARQGIEIPQ